MPCGLPSVDQEIFTLNIIRIKKFCVDKFSRFFLTVDGYIMDEPLECSLCLVYYHVLGELAMADCNSVAVRSSQLVVDRTFTSGGVDVRAHFIVDHCCVNVFTRVLNFRGCFNHEIILTAKFSRPMVFLYGFL